MVQERLRRGIEGVHFASLDEHLDEHMVKQVLGEVLHRTEPSLTGPPPDLQALSTVIMSRYWSTCELPPMSMACITS